MILAFLVSLGLLPPSLALAHPPRVLVATNYDTPERDRWNTGLQACTLRPLTDQEVTIAASWAPCGSRWLIYAPRTGRLVVATVADRMGRGRNRHGIDLAPATRRALRGNGWEQVLVVELPASGPSGGSRSGKKQLTR